MINSVSYQSLTKLVTHRVACLAVFPIIAAVMLTGCATSRSKGQATYDLGPLMSASSFTATQAVAPPITVAEVTSASWLDNQMMHYRLDYANELQPRPYADSRWSMPPAQLLGQRIKARLAQAGGVVLSGVDGAANVPLLRIEATDFSQRFASPAQSDVHVGIRATVLQGRMLVAQKTFYQQRPAPTPNADGAARALTGATDLLITDLMAWLATLPAHK